MDKHFWSQSLEHCQLLTHRQSKFEWFLTKGNGVYIARRVTFSSIWVGSCDDTYLAVGHWTVNT